MLEEISEKAKRLLLVRKFKARYEEDYNNTRASLVELVSKTNQETDPKKPPRVETDDIRVVLTPLPPRLDIDNKKFLELLKKKVPRQSERDKVLVSCMSIRTSDLLKLLGPYKVTEKALERIAQKSPRGPRVEVTLLPEEINKEAR